MKQRKKFYKNKTTVFTFGTNIEVYRRRRNDPLVPSFEMSNRTNMGACSI